MSKKIKMTVKQDEASGLLVPSHDIVAATEEDLLNIPQPEVVDIKDWHNLEKQIGKYCVLYRREQRTPAKLLEVISDKQSRYKILTGPDEGLERTGYYFASTVKFYTDDNLMLALAETQNQE